MVRPGQLCSFPSGFRACQAGKDRGEVQQRFHFQAVRFLSGHHGYHHGRVALFDGIFYEISYDRSLSPPGSKCATTGTEIALDDGIDKNSEVLDGGGGLDPRSCLWIPRKIARPFFRTACCV